MECSYGNARVYLTIDPTISVACPNCGAIRKVNRAQWKEDAFIYPEHDKVAKTTSKATKYYNYTQGKGWHLITPEGEVLLTYAQKHGKQRNWKNLGSVNSFDSSFFKED